MLNDPIIEEIHKYREAFSRKFNNDLKAMVEDLKKRQNNSGHKVVDLSQKPKPQNEPRP